MFSQLDRPPSLLGVNPVSSSSSTTSSDPRSPTITSPPSGQTSTSLPPWARRPSASSARRLSTRRNPYAVAPQEPPLYVRIIQGTTTLAQQALRLFASLSPLHQLLVLAAGLVVLVLTILALIYSHRIFTALAPVAQTWRQLPGGWVLVWLMAFVCAFPPMIGYSTAVTISGFVYGFPLGWPIVATATVAGSTAAFLTSRGVFSGYVHRLVGKDKKFIALGQVLRRDGLGVLAMIRLCPLPYSLSNGFLATVPSIRPLGFAAATACATPKLLVHVFIGSRLALLAESGDRMSAGDRAINYMSMFFGGTLGFVVGLLIYQRTMARAVELATEGAGDGANDELLADDSAENDDYIDGDDSRPLRANGSAMDTDAAALMDDDDISLWGTDGLGNDTAYTDSWDEEAAVGGSGRKPVAWQDARS